MNDYIPLTLKITESKISTHEVDCSGAIERFVYSVYSYLYVPTVNEGGDFLDTNPVASLR